MSVELDSHTGEELSPHFCLWIAISVHLETCREKAVLFKLVYSFHQCLEQILFWQKVCFKILGTFFLFFNSNFLNLSFKFDFWLSWT